MAKKYKGGGTSSYHPRVLLKVLVYAYLDNTYSSRKIETSLKDNIHYMWVSGMITPDHNTINRFRLEELWKYACGVARQEWKDIKVNMIACRM